MDHEYLLAVATGADGRIHMVVSRGGEVVHETAMRLPVLEDPYLRLALTLEALAKDLRGADTPIRAER